VEAMVSAYKTKADNAKKAQTKVTYKQDAWKSLNTKIYSMYSSISSLRYTSAYSLKKTSTSDANKVSVSAGSEAIRGTQSLQIKTLAKAGYLTGGKFSGDVKKTSTMEGLGTSFSGEATVNVKVGDKVSEVKISASDTIEDVLEKFGKAGVTAKFDQANQRIFVSAADSGKDNDFTLTGADEVGLEVLSALKLRTSTAADKATYQSKAGLAVTDEAGEIANLEAIKTAIGTVSAAYGARKDAQTARADAVLERDAAQKKLDTIDKSSTLINDTIADMPNASTDNDKDSHYLVMATEAKKLLDIGDGDHAKTWSDYGIDLADDASDRDIIAAFKADSDIYTKLGNIVNDAKDTSVTDKFQTRVDDANRSIAAKDAEIAAQQATIDSTEVNGTAVKNLYGEGTWLSNSAVDLQNRAEIEIKTAITALETPDGVIDPENSAIKIDGEDAVIELNGARFTSSSNVFNINGLNIQAKAVTADDEYITLTTDTDVDGLYDKIKDFLSQYNSVINEMNKLYNAEAAKGYEPLTDEEKEAMSEKEVEKWESKIKDAILRRDSTLGNLLNSMTSAMIQPYEGADGKKYSFSSFGIHTLGSLNSAANEGYAYHIDGDADDSNTSGNPDKLKAALMEDPDSVIDFIKSAADNLYKTLDKKMKSNSVSSAYKVYNDKELEKEVSSYKTLINKWTEKLTDMEDKYYKQFAAMETALAKLQSNSSSVTGLLGQ
ncbi:MAG: flagellar filament capping protein FliD, partial [Pseudobutyrivibrio sp.]|nr:flagellar filament capping protein FliD [Pseudobutyrivibrio sp.]